MGAAVGACLAGAGHTVLWDPSGRGADTTRRAAAAGLDAVSLDALVSGCDVILSVCPPHAARDVAGAVSGSGYAGVFVDANAVSPTTAREVAETVQRSGATYVDGGIIGMPPASSRHTRLYLAGGGAASVAKLFTGTPLDTCVLTASPYAASALKMSYAAWTKGSQALLLTARALASAEGVDEDLLAEWDRSQPALRDLWTHASASAAAKGWRWAGEMEEIAASMAAHGLPEGFHRAATEVFCQDIRRHEEL